MSGKKEKQKNEDTYKEKYDQMIDLVKRLFE